MEKNTPEHRLHTEYKENMNVPASVTPTLYKIRRGGKQLGTAENTHKKYIKSLKQRQ
jgi:hypothetical protein